MSDPEQHAELDALRQQLALAEKHISAAEAERNRAQELLAEAEAERKKEAEIQRTRWIQCDHARQEAEAERERLNVLLVKASLRDEALTTALSALEKEMRIEAVVAQNFGTKLWADKLAALLAAHPEQP